MDRSLYDEFYRIEADNWWFAARREIVLDQLLRRYGKTRSDLKILDAGCGTGLMLEYLKRFGSVEGLESSDDAVRYCRERYGDAVAVKMGSIAEDPLFAKESFDVVTLLDVLEHIEDDVSALANINELLVCGGILICTVPAFPFLWGGHDVLNRHKRRYRLRELEKKLAAAGLEVETISYYNTFLFPFVALKRLLTPRSARMEPKSDFESYPHWLNRLLKGVFASEKYFLRCLRFPFGVSLICTARRPGGATSTGRCLNPETG